MGTEHQESAPVTQAPHDREEGGHAHTNKLVDSTSPYLLQHAHNPVDWYPWGEEALARAKAEGKPIFLSIGYAACHWCHVMEHQVFEDEKIAELMNRDFINIKVDREERPDLDELYMLATQLMSVSGGWPMSVWLTPELKPFYAGTYFPPTDNYGRPGFPRLTLALAEAWRERRGEILAQAEKVVEAIRQHADETPVGAGAGGGALPTRQWLDAALEHAADKFDETHGGLGGAPKFPPHQSLQLWLGLLSNPEATAHQPMLKAMISKTLDGMMNGGIYDHVGGAFARYSTDERWLVPHFEKMLYDSAQLAPVYASASVLLNRPDYARVARETLDFYLREMVSPQGAFYSSLDADSEGEEGKYYVFSEDDIRRAVGNDDDANLLIAHFGLTKEGNWHETPVAGASVLAVAEPGKPADPRVGPLLLKLRAYRAQRARPGLDDKVLTAWNGLMISALATTGRLLREPRYLEAAHRTIGFLLTRHMEGGKRLLRVSRHHHAHVDAFLDDHAYLLSGLLDLVDSTTPTSLPGTMARRRALELADTLIRDFEDKEHGGFYYTSPSHEQLFARMKNAADNATPSANGVAIRSLLRLARVSGKEHFRDAALRAVRTFSANIARHPDYFPSILLALAEDEQSPQARLLSNMASAPTLQELQPLTAGEAGHVTLAVKDPGPLAAGADVDLELQVTVAPGFHIQPEKPGDREAFATLARIRGDAKLRINGWSYPKPTVYDHGVSGYEKALTITAHCSVPPNLAAGTYAMRATLLAQPCAETACLPPERASANFVLTIR